MPGELRTADQRCRRIWRVVAGIPAGQVMSYGQVARCAGLPRLARFVGRALSAAPAELELPWHRVVGVGGRIALPPGSAAFRVQLRKLRAEGVRIVRRATTVRAVGSEPGASVDELLWGPEAFAPPARRRPRSGSKR